ncbi:hypothetical protein HA402_005758 [Bradysia odoriphaga]|nr:hypothetical protein HA402_005758 [Bradysia odoriphaga]
MQLSLVCFFKKTVPGHIFRGKFRLVKKITKGAMAAQVREYERQDKIMYMLRYPYLTSEESSGHTKHLNKKEQKIAAFTDYKLKTAFRTPIITVEDRLNFLKVKENWD